MQAAPCLRETCLHFLGKRRPSPPPPTKGLEKKICEQTDHTAEQGLMPLNRPQVTRGARRGNGWRSRLRSPGLVAFKNLDTEYRARRGQMGKRVVSKGRCFPAWPVNEF